MTIFDHQYATDVVIRKDLNLSRAVMHLQLLLLIVVWAILAPSHSTESAQESSLGNSRGEISAKFSRQHCRLPRAVDAACWLYIYRPCGAVGPWSKPGVRVITPQLLSTLYNRNMAY
jgi:hypothetical protein